MKTFIKFILVALLFSVYLKCAPGAFVDSNESQNAYGKRFMPGDGVRITVYPDSQSFLNGEYPIDSDGNIFLPIVGKYFILNQTPQNFQKYLSTTFTPYLRFPEVQVQPLVRVSLLGGFERPGLYFVEPERSIWDLIHLAGGPVHENGLRHMRWERDRSIVNKDLIKYIESGESIQKIGFISGDQIWTPSEKPKGIWNIAVREFLIRDIVPLTTLFFSIYYAVNRD